MGDTLPAGGHPLLRRGDAWDLDALRPRSGDASRESTCPFPLLSNSLSRSPAVSIRAFTRRRRLPPRTMKRSPRPRSRIGLSATSRTTAPSTIETRPLLSVFLLPYVHFDQYLVCTRGCICNRTGFGDQSENLACAESLLELRRCALLLDTVLEPNPCLLRNTGTRPSHHNVEVHAEMSMFGS